ncbi:MAG: hypothetical protein JNL93_02625 [Pelomonas sp.]|nr:hypothetical protein [Roseateles sp.]
MRERWTLAWRSIATSLPPLEPLSLHWRRLGLLFVIVLLVAWVLAALGSALQLPGQLGPGFAPTIQRFQIGWDTDERDAILHFWQDSSEMRFIANLYLIVDALIFYRDFPVNQAVWFGLFSIVASAAFLETWVRVRCSATENRLHIYRRPCCTRGFGAGPDTNRSAGLHSFAAVATMGAAQG